MTTQVLKVAVQAEHDLVLVRQRTRQLAEQLGLPGGQRTRLATAVSEIARNAYQYGHGGQVAFLIDRAPTPRLLVRVEDSGPGISHLEEIMEGRYRSTTGLGLGLAGARRLVDYFEIETTEERGTSVTLGFDLPAPILDVQELLEGIDTLTRTSPGNPFGEVLQQNQELLRAQGELVEVNRKLKEAQAAKDRFLAMLGHELRNLLNALRSSQEVIKRRPDQALRQRMEDVAAMQIEHLGRLVDDLLDASRIVRGTLEVQRRPLDLVIETEHTVEAWREKIEGQDLELHFVAPDKPVWVLADPTRIAQVVGNLISNSSKFTDPGGCIQVRIDTDETTATLKVIDDGCGMEERHLQQVFEPFSQTSEARKRMVGGLGLGLAIVKALVEAHEGALEAHSEGVGKGLVLTLQFPVGPPPSVVTQEEGAPGLASKRRILLVDDHEASILGLSELLKLDGHEVEVAGDGPTAIDLVTSFEPEIVICDLGLPEMDGFEVASRLVEMPADMTLIAVSGFVDAASQKKALASGFDRILPKPLDLDVLSQLLRELDLQAEIDDDIDTAE